MKCNQFFTRSPAVSISLFPPPPPFHRLATLVTLTFEFFGRVIKLSEAVLFVLWDGPLSKNLATTMEARRTPTTEAGGNLVTGLTSIRRASEELETFLAAFGTATANFVDRSSLIPRAEFISQFSALNADRTLSLSNCSGLISANRTLPVS